MFANKIPSRDSDFETSAHENPETELKCVTFSIPTFNEEESLPRLFVALEEFAERYKTKYKFEFLFSDNCSTDRSWDIISNKAHLDVRYRAIRLTKNFGFQNSILANYREAKGDAVIQLDADLQDPIEVVHEFIAFWEQGIQIVLGRRLKRKERYTISLMRRIGYWMISFLADIRIEQNVGDFRLLDREVVNTLISTRHPRPYLRGLVSNLGFSSAIVEFNREKRMHGESKFPILDLFKMGITALLNHSKLPERLMQSVTLVSIIGSTAGAVYYLVARFIQTDWPKGFASLYVLLLLSIALNAVFSLIMFRYIRQIHLIATGEPNYIIGQRIN